MRTLHLRNVAFAAHPCTRPHLIDVEVVSTLRRLVPRRERAEQHALTMLEVWRRTSVRGAASVT